METDNKTVSEMLNRQQACAFFGIGFRTWVEWERQGRVRCGQWGRAKSGNRCKVYPKAELEKLKEEVRRLSEPYPDPLLPNVYRVPVTSRLHRMEAIIDAADLPVVQGRHWNWAKRGDGSGGNVVLATFPGPQTPLHRLIAGAVGREVRVSFANGNRLDCRRANIVVLTSQEQLFFTRKMGTVNGRKYTSNYKGVSWDESRGRWLVQITKGGVYRHVGRFGDEIDAAEAYDRAAVELFGEHARLNFPDGIDARLDIEASANDSDLRTAA